MHSYWLTFRLANTGNFAGRLAELKALINQKCERLIWQEPTSFILFRSKLDIDALARHLRKGVDPSEDMLLIGMVGYKVARLVGVPGDHSIYALLPYVEDI